MKIIATIICWIYSEARFSFHATFEIRMTKRGEKDNFLELLAVWGINGALKK
jgi:hypothetical protein